MELYTIGAYGKGAEDFFGALEKAGIEILVDIRRRRGIRGSGYAYANKTRLEQELAARGIRCVHLPQLAPPPELRRVQKQADQAARTLKSERQTLSPAFCEGYRAACLKNYTWDDFVRDVGGGESKVALFCVEGPASACHRSLVVEHFGRPATHL
jgi:hypothetical protein